ncbi:MAG: TetR family transcriptional regulator [Acidobacteriales bacterium 59-55]|nr:TetR/AcrR family transcriptional regulator [Terriglobales bacterium]OJV44622.1 MAG: TetR family transcriptional regulator [Acidobacteriales bacterium 59-55]
MARPRSIQAHRKVLEAAAELFAQQGIDATSMDAIAESSGVSKATIYKHWPDKDALCLEVLGYVHGLDEEPPVFDSGDFRADLIAALRHQPAADRQAMKEKIWPHLMAYSARNRAFGDAWRAKVLEPARTGLTASIKRGEKLGVLRSGIDPEIGIALLLGPMMYRHIFAQRLGRRVPKDLEVHVVDAFLAAFAKAPKNRP